MMTDFIERITSFDSRDVLRHGDEIMYHTHAHPTAEITLLLEGKGFYTAGSQKIDVYKGDLLLIPPRLKHGFACTLAWDVKSLHLFTEKLPSYCHFLFSRICENMIVHVSLCKDELVRANSAIRQVEKACKLSSNSSLAVDLKRNGIETLLLLALSKFKSQMSVQEEEKTVTFEDVLQKIHQTFTQSIKIKELADQFYLSESMFRKKFKERTGVTPKQYIIQLRINEAKHLLEHTDRPVEFILSEVGFSSSSRFHEAFLKRTCMTPLEWRNSNIKINKENSRRKQK
ncbi:AraC-like DNA-binding protein [Lederbergia galactosidilyticus]|nr:AraC-like DNA-binding protein [Lederbergia galactosidilytica]